MTENLLHDAEAYLRYTAQAGDLSLLETAFVAWLRVEPVPPALAQELVLPLRQYEHVALASLAEAAGWAIDKPSLEDGLFWLIDVSLERASVPAPVVSDGLALVALGLAARERPWLATWHDHVLEHGAATVVPAWLAEGGRVVRGDTRSCAPELRIALASRGVVSGTEVEAKELMQRILQGELPDDAFHAHVLLVALDWTRRLAPSARPDRAVKAAAEMLPAVSSTARVDLSTSDKSRLFLEFLEDAFTVDEFRRLLTFSIPGGQFLARELPDGADVARRRYMHLFVELFERMGPPEPDFFKVLKESRPARSAEVESLKRLYCSASLSAANAASASSTEVLCGSDLTRRRSS